MAKIAKLENSDQEKDSLLEKLKALEKRYGSGTIIMGRDTKEELEIVDSGSLTVNLATNLGGLPVGKLIELLGMESSGKSTMTLHAIANFQKLPGKCVLVDYEQAFDRTYATALGVDMEKLIIIQPECMEDGYNMTEELIKTGNVRLVVHDSHTAAMPKKVVEGEVGDATIGLQARLNSQGLGKIKPHLKANRCTLIGISQIRQNIGGYGDPNQSTGGLAWKFYSDMRMKVNKSVDKENESNKTTVEVIKNKCAAPFGKAEFVIDWGKGVSRMMEIISLAQDLKLITRAGAWYTLPNLEKTIQGEQGVYQFLIDNPEYAESIETEVLGKLKELK
jgi:recombination protein RecA